MLAKRLTQSSLLQPVEYSPRGRSSQDAAVLILLSIIGGRLHVLFEKRAKRALDRWSAQIAFPGGRFHPSDQTLDRTACREFLEETGADACGNFQVLGFLRPFHPGNQPEITVFPFICIATGNLVFNPNEEVEELFWIPIEGMKYMDSEIDTQVRAIRTKALVYDNRVVWGMTQRIVESLAQILGIKFRT